MKNKIMALIALSLCNFTSSANSRFDDVKITYQQLSDSTYMFTGAGGNIGVSAGNDGILIIDDQFAPLADKISTQLSKIKQGAPKYIINTHYHGDHTGGNQHFGAEGTILAHHNVLKRLKTKEGIDTKALPVVTYDKGISIHFNNNTLNVVHLKPGHTDGDSVVLWSDLSVVHMGDLFFKDNFPYVDLNGGGSVMGYRDNVEYVLGKIAENTKVIPGHGALATKSDLMKFKVMLDQSISWMQQQIAQGKSLEEIEKSGLPEQLKSWSWGFITEGKWIKTLYQDLKA